MPSGSCSIVIRMASPEPRGLVTACSNCRHMLEDGLEDNDMHDIELIGITELIAEHLVADTKQAG